MAGHAPAVSEWILCFHVAGGGSELPGGGRVGAGTVASSV